MKKIISLLVCLTILLSFTITANAAGVGVSVAASASSAAVGSNVTYTVSLSGGSSATSGSIAVTFDEGLELVSGEFLKSGATLSKFDTSTKKGAIAFSSATDLSGDYFKLVLSCKTASANAQSVSFSVELKNGATSIGTGSASKTVSIVCANHSYSAWTSTGNTQHKRTCSVCGTVDNANHTWNSGTTTKPATCKEAGSKTYTCTACGATKSEVISKSSAHQYGSWTVTKPAGCTTSGTQQRTCSVCNKVETATINATNHSYGSWSVTKNATCTSTGTETRKCSKCTATEERTISALGHSFTSPTVTKEATCTEPGVETGKCTRCSETTSQSIPATGHKYGKWTEKTAATCTETGVQEKKCSVCGSSQERTLQALGHDFEDPTVIQEATISQCGISEGKCKRCGETTQQKTPCTVTDAATEITIEADEGVFEADTEIAIEPIADDDARLESVTNALADVSKTFKAFNIRALLNNSVVQPNGRVKVILPIPENFGTNVALYFVSDEGVTEELEITVNDDNTISTELEHFSIYAICKLDEADAVEATVTEDELPEATATPQAEDFAVTDEAPENTSSKTGIIIAVIIAVVVIACGAVAFIIIRKKKTLGESDKTDEADKTEAGN